MEKIRITKKRNGWLLLGTLGFMCAIICVLVIGLRIVGFDPIELGKNQLFIIAAVGLVGLLVFLKNT